MGQDTIFFGLVFASHGLPGTHLLCLLMNQTLCIFYFSLSSIIVIILILQMKKKPKPQKGCLIFPVTQLVPAGISVQGHVLAPELIPFN